MKIYPECGDEFRPSIISYNKCQIDLVKLGEVSHMPPKKTVSAQELIDS